MSSAYNKFYKINMNKTNPNKCLLKLPANVGNARYGWATSFEDVLFNYLLHCWFNYKGMAENTMYKYVKSVINHESFDFDNYTYNDKNDPLPNPFKEIKKTHESCVVHIYSDRIYTNFTSSVLEYQGTKVSLLATLVKHPEFIKSLEYPDAATKNRYELRRYNMDKKTEFNYFVSTMLKQEELTSHEKQIIIDGFNEFINHLEKQEIYSPDELIASHSRDVSCTNIIFSLYLEFFIYINDEENIYKLYETFHKVGNKKAEVFNTYLKQKDKDEKSTFTERPVGKYLMESCVHPTKIVLDELFYFFSFYEKYNDGKFLSKVVSNNLLQDYIMSFKTALSLGIAVSKKYYDLFDKLKDEDTYSLETFEQMNLLVSCQLEGSKALDILEQNFSILEICLNNDVYSSRWSSDIYNLFTHINYEDKLDDNQKIRYWKMVANFVNNTKLKSARIKKILSDITKLLGITTGDIITNLQPHVISIKQPILLEMYLE